MDYTVIVADYGEHPTIPRTRAILSPDQPTPEHAAGLAEVIVATETWERRYPDQGEPYDAEPRMDDEWIACMESVSTLAVIEGTPTVILEDDIYA